MSILCDRDLVNLMYRGFLMRHDTSVDYFDLSLVNPASIDVCIGPTAIVERGYGNKWTIPLSEAGLVVEPGEMLLVGTEEVINVPNGYAVDLRLKSTSARQGWDHNAALWIDPGFHGVITLELRNCNRFTPLVLKRGQRIAQAVVHQLTGPASQPYNGRYQGAASVEGPKITE